MSIDHVPGSPAKAWPGEFGSPVGETASGIPSGPASAPHVSAPDVPAVTTGPDTGLDEPAPAPAGPETA